MKIKVKLSREEVVDWMKRKREEERVLRCIWSMYVLYVQCRLCWHVLCNALLMPLIELKYFIMKESSLTSIMYTTWKA